MKRLRVHGHHIAVLTVLTVVGAGSSLPAETIDPDNDGSQYVWSENTGWINAEPLGNGGPGVRMWDG